MLFQEDGDALIMAGEFQAECSSTFQLESVAMAPHVHRNARLGEAWL